MLAHARHASIESPMPDRGLSMASALRMLDAAGWGRDALERVLPQVLAAPGMIDPRERAPWMCGLRGAFGELPCLDAATREGLLDLLRSWCDWPLWLALRDAGAAHGDDARIDGTDPDTIDALFRMGHQHEAETRCRRRLFTHPRDPATARMHAQLQAWRGFVDARAPPIEDEALRLEPLGHHHCTDFAWQYWDPDIARLCCLPVFGDDAAWHRWLDECWGYGDQRLYAVLHRDWGFVGSVSLTLHGDLGFFYYWIGRDFQGQGLGPAAVRLLLADAFDRHGMRACYAKVFEHNAPSRRALARLGFEALDFRPAPPHEDELLYRLGPPQGRWDSADALRALFERMGSQTRVAVPLRGAARNPCPA
jgi:RimJ/RimL family protein N-acetyltransferase